jgi:hypothetical protein
MVMVLELLVLSHTIHIDRAREKTYRNTPIGFIVKPALPSGSYQESQHSRNLFDERKSGAALHRDKMMMNANEKKGLWPVKPPVISFLAFLSGK